MESNRPKGEFFLIPGMLMKLTGNRVLYIKTSKAEVQGTRKEAQRDRTKLRGEVFNSRCVDETDR